MGFGLNLGIPDPRQWKRQQVPHAIVDEHRVSKIKKGDIDVGDEC